VESSAQDIEINYSEQVYDVILGDEGKRHLMNIKNRIRAKGLPIDDKLDHYLGTDEMTLEDKLEYLRKKGNEELAREVDAYIAEQAKEKEFNEELSRILNTEERKRFLEATQKYLERRKSEIDGAENEQDIMDDLGYNRILRQQFENYVYYEDTSSIYRSTIGLNQNAMIFGWHPYWLGESYKSYNFELLTIISYFSYDLNPSTGGSRNTFAINNWRESELVEKAHEKNTKVLLTVSNHGASNNRLFLSNKSTKIKDGDAVRDISAQERQQILIDSLLYYVQEKGADGVDINFENVHKSYRKEFTLFVKNLSTQFKAQNKDYIITLTVEPSLSKAYDLSALMEFVDLVVIMGYESHNASTGNGNGPLSPLDDLERTVEQYTEAGMDKSLLVLALPHYGTKWIGDNFEDYLTYSEIRMKYDDRSPIRDEENHTVKYIEGDTIIWWDDSTSLKAKYDWIIEQELGMGIWALGYDNGYDDIWAAIDEKFTGVQRPPQNMTKSLTLIRTLRKYRNLIVVSCIFITTFVILGVIISFWDWKVRQVFFEAKTFRLIYIIFGFIILMVLLVNSQWIDMRWVLSVIGILFGLLFMAFVVKSINIRRRSMP
jgi:spore germination protein YaaH